MVWPRSEAYKSQRSTADTPFRQLCICTWSGFGFVHRASALKLYIANLDYNTVFTELLKVSKYYNQCNFLPYCIIGFKNYQSFHYRTHVTRLPSVNRMKENGSQTSRNCWSQVFLQKLVGNPVRKKGTQERQGVKGCKQHAVLGATQHANIPRARRADIGTGKKQSHAEVLWVWRVCSAHHQQYSICNLRHSSYKKRI